MIRNYIIITISLVCLQVNAVSKQEIFTEIYDNIFYHTNEAHRQLDSLQSTFTVEDSIAYKPYCNTISAFTAYKEGQFSLALDLADSALSYFLWNENKEWQARSILVLAFTAEALGLDSEAVDYYEVAVSMFSDPALKGFSMLGNARCCKWLGKEWLQSMNSGINQLLLTNQKEHVLYANSIPYWFDKSLPNMIENLDSIAVEYIKLKMWVNASSTYKLISQHYRSKKDYDLALEYCTKSFECISKENSNVCLYSASIYSNFAAIYTELGLSGKSVECIQKAIDTYLLGDVKLSLYYPYKELNQIYTNLGDYKQANYSAQQALESYILMSEIKKSSAAQLAEILINREYIEDQLTKIKHKQFIKYCIFILLSIVFVSIIGIKFFDKKKYYLKLINSLKRDNEMLQLEKRELIVLIDKMDTEEEVKKIMVKLKNIVLEDPELDATLPGYFYNNYHKSLVKLKAIHPSLSEAEVRSAVMLAMDLPSSTISNLLCIQPESVKKYRNRIRKKIKLDSKVDLGQHLKIIISDALN